MERWVPLAAAGVAALLVATVAAWLVFQDPDSEEGSPDAVEGEGTPTSDEDGETPTDGADGDEVDDDRAPPVVVDRNQEPEANATIHVPSARIEPGPCMGENDSGEEACHRLQGVVDAYEEEMFDVAIRLWEAEDAQGNRHAASEVVSPDPVPAGTSRTVEISFELSPETRLVALEHSDFQGRSLSAPVPEYE